MPRILLLFIAVLALFVVLSALGLAELAKNVSIVVALVGVATILVAQEKKGEDND